MALLLYVVRSFPHWNWSSAGRQGCLTQRPLHPENQEYGHTPLPSYLGSERRSTLWFGSTSPPESSLLGITKFLLLSQLPSSLPSHYKQLLNTAMCQPYLGNWRVLIECPPAVSMKVVPLGRGFNQWELAVKQQEGTAGYRPNGSFCLKCLEENHFIFLSLFCFGVSAQILLGKHPNFQNKAPNIILK